LLKRADAGHMTKENDVRGSGYYEFLIGIFIAIRLSTFPANFRLFGQ